jgi:hypothetical protein
LEKIKNVGHLKPYKRATPLLSLPLSPPTPFLLEEENQRGFIIYMFLHGLFN